MEINTLLYAGNGTFVCYKVNEKEEVMKPNVDKIQVILGGVVFLGIIVFGAFFLMDKLRIANSISDATVFVFGIACLYTGLRRISQASKAGVKILWYKQPWILLSILLLCAQAARAMVSGRRPLWRWSYPACRLLQQLRHSAAAA